MSENINQVFIANPITTNAATDLMYFGQSPYAPGNDAAMTYANFAAQFGAPYTPAALTSSNDTNVTLTLGGSPTTALIHAASITVGWSGTLAVTRGGLGIGTVPTNGQIPIGNGANYVAATITAGTGISISVGAGSITVSSNGAAPWVDETGASVTMATNTGYTSDDGASLVTFTLPATAAIGDWVEINGKGSGGWTLIEGSGQIIHFGNQTTTVTTGSISSTNQWDCIRLRCVTANTTFTVVSAVGNLTIV